MNQNSNHTIEKRKEKRGRPRISADTRNKVVSLYQENKNYKEIAKICKISLGSVYNILKEVVMETPEKVEKSDTDQLADNIKEKIREHEDPLSKDFVLQIIEDETEKFRKVG